MGYNISYQVLTVLIGHDITVQITWLYKVIVRVSIRRTSCKSRYFEWGFQKSRIWDRTTKTIWPVIGTAATIGINTHESVTLIIIFRQVLWRIHRDQVIIGTKTVNMSVGFRCKNNISAF